MTFIKANFLSLIILLLVGLVIVERCSQKIQPPAKPIIVRDTVWTEREGTVASVPQLVNSIPYPVDRLTKEIQYLPDTNYHKLLVQYQTLLALYLAKNILKDSLKIDSIGHVYVSDTVTKNLISSRKYIYNLKYPIITNTVTLPYKSRNQLYIGGGLEGNPGALINQINAGMLWKNRKDQIFGAYIGVDGNTTFQYGIQSYWKINLRRK
jgi:hypothetical protein